MYAIRSYYALAAGSAVAGIVVGGSGRTKHVEVDGVEDADLQRVIRQLAGPR